MARHYKTKEPVIVVDDAGTGICPDTDTLYHMGLKVGLGMNDWVAVCIALGVAATGAFLVVMAVIDPEPFSKIGFALGAGTAMTMGGGFAAVRVLTKQRPPNVRVTAQGFEIDWSDAA